MHILPGASWSEPPQPGDLTSARYVELALRSPLPKRKRLSAWRHTNPPDVALGLVAPAIDAGSQEPLLHELGELAEAVRARLLLFPTPRDVTPGRAGRTHVERLFKRAPRLDGLRLVWIPSGLWEAADARMFAQHLGVTCALAPTDLPVEDTHLYVRSRTIGARRRHTETVLEELYQRLCACPRLVEAHIALLSPYAAKEAAWLTARALSKGDLPHEELGRV